MLAWMGTYFDGMIKRSEGKSGLTAASIAGVYIGAVIGAGFASGQEIWRFFGLYGSGGLIGLALSSLLFAVFAWAVLRLAKSLDARSHLEVVTHIGGPLWGRLMDSFLTVSLPAGLTIMLAGAGAGLVEQYNIPSVVGSVAMMLASVITVLMGVHGVVAAISLMAPFLVGMVVVISWLTLRMGVVNWRWALASSAPPLSWLVSSLAYVSYNLVLAVSVLAPMGPLSDKRAMYWGAIWGGLGLGVSATAVNIAVLSQGSAVVGCDVPMLLAAARVLPRAPYIYTILLMIEIYTTAVANLYGFGVRLAPVGSKAFGRVVVITGCLCLLGAQVGFSRLVAVIYRIMGYVGALFLVALTIWFWRRATDEGS